MSRPLTRREWERLRPSKTWNYLQPHDAERIEATIDAGGFAPDEPTLEELDRWAAENLMGWHDSGHGYWTYHGQHVDMGKIMTLEEWEPTRDLGQALRCVSERRGNLRIDLRMQVAAVWVGIDGPQIYGGDYDEAAIAEAIVRKLHAELTS